MEIYKIRFGKKITKEEAAEKADKLIRIVELTFKPMTATESKLLQKRRKETNFQIKNIIAHPPTADRQRKHGKFQPK